MKDLLFYLLHHFGVSALLRQGKRGRITILCLHRVTEERDPFFPPITPHHFEEIVRYAMRHYHVVGFEDLAQLDSKSQKPYLILSFDDGYYDFLEYALPILQKHGLRSNHNIVNACADGTSFIWTERLNYLFNHCRVNGIDLSFEDEGIPLSIKGFGGDWQAFNLQTFMAMLQLSRAQRLPIIDRKEAAYGVLLQRRMMTWEEIRQCAEAGVEIGSHTYTHDVLSTITDELVLQHEIAGSRQEIEARLGRTVSILALPNGQGNSRVDAAAAKAGFKQVLYVGNQTNALRDSSLPPRTLSRIGVNEESLPESALRIELFHSKLRSR